MTDKTSYAQSLMHMIKGNLGTGILAMPASFAHAGLINAIYGLPALCVLATYCVHLLVKSSKHLEGRSKGLKIQYASLAKHSFKSGPDWMRASSDLMGRVVDGILLVAQLGVCCVYLVFVADNITSILTSYKIYASKSLVFAAIFPIALLLSYIKTLKKLAIASACANVLQALGISIILEYLMRDLDKVDMSTRDCFRPFDEVALGFGSAMFAFEGISMVLPVYTKMKNSDRMSGFLGVINVSYFFLLVLYFMVGLFGYLKFGHDAKGSITLNLPPEPIYDGVRAVFTVSVFLTYPLQFYVPNEIIWQWAKRNLLTAPEKEISVIRAIEVVLPKTNVTEIVKGEEIIPGTLQASGKGGRPKDEDKSLTLQQEPLQRYNYLCRTIIVIITFVLAVSVPKLNLLMDLIGSITGTALSVIIPSLIHMGAFWDSTSGFTKAGMVVIDSLIIAVGFAAGMFGSVSSLTMIVQSFRS